MKKNPAKTLRILGIFLFMLLFNLENKIVAQDTLPVFYFVNYYKVDRGENQKYIELIKNYSSKLLEERVKSGEVLSWQFYSLAISSAENSSYDYVSVIKTNMFNAVFDPKQETKELFKKVFPGFTQEKIEAIMKEFDDTRIFMKEEIYYEASGFQLKSIGSRFIRINYMKAPTATVEQYYDMERKYFLTLHKELAKTGAMSGWRFLSKVPPITDNPEFNFLTVEDFEDYLKFLDMPFFASFKKLNPQEDADKFFEKIVMYRSCIRQDILKLEYSLDKSTIRK